MKSQASVGDKSTFLCNCKTLFYSRFIVDTPGLFQLTE